VNTLNFLLAGLLAAGTALGAPPAPGSTGPTGVDPHPVPAGITITDLTALPPAAAVATLAGLPVRYTADPDSHLAGALVTPAEQVVATGPVAVEEFMLLGVTWDGTDGHDAGDVAVHVRVREHGTWSPWQQLGTPDDKVGDPTVRVGTDPLLTGGDADAFQVRVATTTGDVPAGLRVDTIDPGTSAADAALDNLAAPAAAGAPTIITRAQWGADEKWRRTPPKNTTFKAAVIHHTETTNDYTKTQVPAMLRSIYSYHARTLGWHDIAYHFLVDKWGRVYEGRAGSITGLPQGQHAAGFNQDTLGVSALGNYLKTNPPQVVVDTLAEVVGWKLGQYGVNPAGTVSIPVGGHSLSLPQYAKKATKVMPVVTGHLQTSRTDCPGRLMSHLEEIRAKAATKAGFTFTRHAGSDRYATSAAISAQFTPGVPAAYIASGANFPDALAGAALAGKQDSPVLLTRRDSLPGPVAAELARLKPKRIIILGGPASVSEQVAAQLGQYATAADGQLVSRYGGENRYDTAATIASKYPAGVPVAYVATGDAYPDALAGAALAGAKDAPILLTRSGEIPEPVAAQLDRLRPGRIVILGGPVSVSQAVEAQLARYTPGTVTRLAGQDRYGTAAAVSAQFAKGRPVAYLASGGQFPDALSGAALAGSRGVPVLLTRAGALPGATGTELARLAPKGVTVLGGTSAVTDKAARAAAAYTR
jgi:putative cell wall-binding protein